MTEQTPAEPAPAKKNDRASTWIAIAIGAVILLCVGAAVIRGSKPDPGATSRDAERVCQDFVKKRLKAPATADFSGLSTEDADPTYTVTGDVDAENSFGAKLRSHFTCVVTDAGSDWRLVSVDGIN